MIGDNFPGLSIPSAEPEGPLELLSRLHSNTLQYCARLRLLVSHLDEYGCDDEARGAAESVLGCFGHSAPKDFRDEEEDLFPALLESMAGSDAVCLNQLTSGMTLQHRTLEMMWERLRKPLAAVASGQGSTLDSAEVEAFVTLYQSHIEREQSELFPMAARLLTDEALEQVWDSMRKRHSET